MDSGNDAALSARYRVEHEVANKCTIDAHKAGRVLTTLRRLRDEKQVLGLSMDDLVNHGYTPSVLVTSGIPWSKLQRKHGASSLIDMGFTWEHMRSGGITAEEACAIGMSKLCIGADELMELAPSIQTIASMQLPLADLKESGFTLDKLTALGLNHKTMRRFGYTLGEWQRVYDMDWSSLGFTEDNYRDCEMCGWDMGELHNVLHTTTTTTSLPTTTHDAGLEF